MPLVLSLMLSGCIGSLIGAVVDTTVEVVKIPFKVGGAIIDVVTSDDLTEKNRSADRSKSDEDDMAMQSEGEVL